MIVTDRTEEHIDLQNRCFNFYNCELGPDNNVYFADRTNNLLKRWDLVTGELDIMASFDNEISTMAIITDNVSPVDLEYYNYNLETETIQGVNDFDGGLSYWHPLIQFSDELKIMNGSGVIIDVSGDITFHSCLPYDYQDAAFYDSKIFILHEEENTIELIVLDANEPYGEIAKPVEFFGRKGRRLFIKDDRLVIVTQEYDDYLINENRIYISNLFGSS